VVVFDRIREHMGIYKKKEFNSLVNNALNSTLSRTVNTSLTTFFVLLVIFLFGGEVIRGELARGLGKGMRELRDASDEIKREIRSSASSVKEEIQKVEKDLEK
jgi:Sec-independent protein translocase protein TatA